MRTLRLIGRGLSDTLEHLLPFTLLTLGWWLGVFLVVPGPGATVALFAMTDPRRESDSPEWREAVAAARANLGKGWALALVTLTPLVVLAANLGVYAGEGGRWAWLVPLWTYLLVFGALGALYAVSVAALTGAGVRDALRRAVGLVAMAPVRSLGVTAVVVALTLVGVALVVPLVMFLPAMVAAIVNRLVLAGLGIEVPDPLAPTPEREAEERRASASSRFGP
jgi:uncharacterized membrane protein YesL